MKVMADLRSGVAVGELVEGLLGGTTDGIGSLRRQNWVLMRRARPNCWVVSCGLFADVLVMSTVIGRARVSARGMCRQSPVGELDPNVRLIVSAPLCDLSGLGRQSCDRAELLWPGGSVACLAAIPVLTTCLLRHVFDLCAFRDGGAMRFDL